MVKYIKYLNPLLIYILAILSFTNTGILCWLVLIYSWIIIPLAEIFIKPSSKNMTAAEEEIAKNDTTYDYLLYLIVLIQLPTLFFFLYSFTQSPNLRLIDVMGRITAMGMLCGTFGINVAHELGHRKNKFEQTLAKISLLSSLYMHFFIEHNKGHHKHVATYNDPSSARLNEPVYLFYFRTIFYSYKSAWQIANKEMQKKGLSVFNFHNTMLQFQIIQVVFMLVIYLIFGLTILGYFLAASFIGILLLETVNYIEHYGLQRKMTTLNNYERALPHHSWNSNHILGRLLLFELSRHSDHHFLASRKYQILKHHNDSPQLPTGYPGSMIIALIPPLWFYIMNKKIKNAVIF